VTKPFDVFLSYAKPQDGVFAFEIKDCLRKAGYKIFSDESLLVGQDMSQQVPELIKQSHSVIILLSGAAVGSRWVAPEVALALRENKVVIPVLLEEIGAESALMSLVGDRQVIRAIGQPPSEVAQIIYQNLLSENPALVVRLEAKKRSRFLVIAFTILILMLLLGTVAYWMSKYTELETQQKETAILTEVVQHKAAAQRLIYDGIAYAQKGQLTRAIDLYREAIRLEPTNAGAYQYLGYAHLRRSQLKPHEHPDDVAAAVAALTKAVSIDPAYPWAHYNLALAYWAAGKHEDAIKSIKKLLDLDPSFRTTIRDDAQFDQFKTSPQFLEYMKETKSSKLP
jgi:tetratricopeptide (TPR) repeat protein